MYIIETIEFDACKIRRLKQALTWNIPREHRDSFCSRARLADLTQILIIWRRVTRLSELKIETAYNES